ERVRRRDERAKLLDKLNMEGDGMRLRHRRPPIIRGRDNAAHYDQRTAIPQEEVAMRTGPRCSECDSEDPKIICLRNPARERYCGRSCLREGQQQFIRWIQRANAEAAS